MFDFGYFDITRENITNVWIYRFFYLFAVGILAYAALWDHRQRRVPNALWLAALIPVPAALTIRDLTMDAVFLPVLFIVCLALRFQMSWGMGDAKGIVWMGLLLGSFPAIMLTILAIALTAFIPKKELKGMPFMIPLGMASVLGLGLMMIWLR